MRITDIELEALRKFNGGKNAKILANDLEPGTYPVQVTFTLAGTLTKDEPGTTTRRTTAGSNHITRFLLDHASPKIVDYLIANLPRIRKGEFSEYDPPRLEQLMNIVMPYQEIARQGSTTFAGTAIIEDNYLETGLPETDHPGLRLMARR